MDFLLSEATVAGSPARMSDQLINGGIRSIKRQPRQRTETCCSLARIRCRRPGPARNTAGIGWTWRSKPEFRHAPPASPDLLVGDIPDDLFAERFVDRRIQRGES